MLMRLNGRHFYTFLGNDLTANFSWSLAQVSVQAWIPFYGSSLQFSQEVVGYPMTLVTLLHKGADLAWKFVIIAHRIHSRVRALIPFLPWKSA